MKNLLIITALLTTTVQAKSPADDGYITFFVQTETSEPKLKACDDALKACDVVVHQLTEKTELQSQLIDNLTTQLKGKTLHEQELEDSLSAWYRDPWLTIGLGIAAGALGAAALRR